ncbi:hypothetical protein AC249_AIPGENE9340 [Exaiptasia diaphana]|nr:hypothetical protein AC249_AIPGENE9340 [Exaiptasia diaphana]
MHLDPNPVVIDADDVVKFPEEMMFSFCRAVGIDYKPEMSQWELGLPKDLEEHYKLYPAEYVSAWAGYVSSSSCFHQTNKHDSNNVQLPEEMEKVVEKSMPCYEDMRKNRIQI